ncbi:MAG: hypothetical protein RBS43_05750 [Candidatus Cloacimonas sp.]|jgi:hypothetical protein|nr:hypothetical protein [Candidatus Cloacimonas sp.]
MKKARLLCLILLTALCLQLGAVKQGDAVKPAMFNGVGLPKLAQMTKLSGNSAVQVKPGDLNIVADYFCYSEDRFYTAMQTKSGSFPKSGKLGTAWYSFMTVIAKPDNEKIVWALTYINVPMAGLKPGLYRVDNGKKQELKRIGNIEYQIDKDSNLLRMSCRISDLLADPDFSAWYNKAAPSFGLLSMSSCTTIFPFKTKTVDSTNPGRLIKLGK